MNPITAYFAPYKTIIEVILIGALIIGISVAIHSFLEHERDIGRNEVHAEWDKQKLADKVASDKQEKDWRDKYDLAINTGAQNAQTLKLETAATRVASDRLRDTNTSLQQLLANSTAEAARKYAAAYANVFNDCVGKYQEMGIAAQGHANDSKALASAWPSLKFEAKR